MSAISSRLGLAPHACIAVVGAGGKTALCWQLIQEARQRHQKVIFTTTTKIWQPSASVFDVNLTHTSVADTLHALTHQFQNWDSACLMGAATDWQGNQPIVHSSMPVVATKRSGIDPADICALHTALPEIIFIVEADGARNLPLKAPADNEPVIPACVNIVCVLANLDAIGQPLDERTVHRSERFAQLTGLALGAPITPEALLHLLTHPAGGLKGIPTGARTIAVLTQRHATTTHPATALLASTLIQHGYQDAITLSVGFRA